MTKNNAKRLNHLIVRAPNWIGDHVMADAFYRGVRAHFPAAKITLLGPAPLAALLPEGFDHFIALDRDTPSIGGGRFDGAISLPASWSSAWMLWRARIPWRVGFAETLARPLYTKSLAWKGRAAGRHKADLYAELLSRVGAPAMPAPRLSTVAVAGHAPILIAPAASIELREWPYYAELARALSEKFPAREIHAVGTAADGARWGPKLAGIPRVRPRFGDTDLRALIVLARAAALVVANDSGVAHLAATLAGAPTLVIFGPGDPRYVLPRGPRVRAVHTEGPPCRPCERAHCAAPYGYQACLRELTLPAVLSEAVGML